MIGETSPSRHLINSPSSLGKESPVAAEMPLLHNTSTLYLLANRKDFSVFW